MINVYFSELPKTLTEILGLKYDETMSYEERVQKRYDYIKEQYEVNPRFEGWDYIENIKYGLELDHLVTFKYLISTNGRVLTTIKLENKYNTLEGKITRFGYKSQGVRINNKRYELRVHRAQASTFIPKYAETCTAVNMLIVNHKDLNKLNNHFTNLEWCTHKENTIHAAMSGAFDKNLYFNKCLKSTWLLDDVYKGFEFRVKGRHGLAKLGLNIHMLKYHLQGRAQSSFGCTWKVITKEEFESLPDAPEFIVDKMLNDITYLDRRVKPLKGTILKQGKWKGLTFAIYGKKELDRYGFSLAGTHVVALSDTRKSAQGCGWKFITRDEAELLPRGLTEEQMEYLGLKSKLYTM